MQWALRSRGSAGVWGVVLATVLLTTPNSAPTVVSSTRVSTAVLLREGFTLPHALLPLPTQGAPAAALLPPVPPPLPPATSLGTHPPEAAAPPATASPHTTTPAPRLVGWGAYEEGWPVDTAGLAHIEALAGRRANLIQTYVHWGGGWGSFPSATPFITASLAHGATPVVTWLSDDPSISDQSAYAPGRIAAGAWDTYARGWADGLRSLHAPVMLRFDPEMNGNWASYSPGINGITDADYVGAWKHLHELFAAEGATNVVWVWSPNVEYQGSTPLRSLYPGDAFVDWVALDGYNWGNTNGHAWQSFSGVFDQSLTDLTALTGRPLMLAEVASSDIGGDKAAWISDMFTQLLQRPEIRAFIWFDLNKETDWSVASTPGAASAFTTGMARVSSTAFHVSPA